MDRLRNKVALVTGSTRGLGRAIAEVFAAEGARVVVTGRTVSDGKNVVDNIQSNGGTAEFVPLDLASEDSVKAAMDKAVECFGSLDILVNNAAPTEFITGSASGELADKVDNIVTEISTEDWRKITIPSIDGLFWCLKYSIPKMQQAGAGSIVNISSTASIRSTSGMDAYTASKGAMNALTASIAFNYRPLIRCNCLVAGLFATEGLAPLLADPVLDAAFKEVVLTPRIGDPLDIAYAATFLASDESAYITGQLLPVDGGIGVYMPIPKIGD
jgi:NAD(P)-dependent dehydrogenase (short-subunit alcohol dehydrogenase family)